jgi:acetoacetyl-CoA reductase/3-oxoacyl-[acyl-carrier protein] reductase
MAGRLSGKVAVVTGGANGIGRASAIRFGQDGAAVAILDLEEGPLQETAEAIRAAGGRVLPIALDLTNRSLVTDAFQRVRKELGPVHTLLNNVGQTAREKITEFWQSEPETWDFVIQISLMTTLMCTRLVLPDMRERKEGKIVSIASESPLAGDANIADYCAAKLGVVGFTRSIAREMAPFGVNVNAVAPGATNTRGPRRMPNDALARVVAQIPMGKMCEPEDIANAVSFLASEEARFITGQVLVVNGGRVFH